MICSRHNLAQMHHSTFCIQDGSVGLPRLWKYLYQERNQAEQSTPRTPALEKAPGLNMWKGRVESAGCGSTAVKVNR